MLLYNTKATCLFFILSRHRINLNGCVDRGFYYYGTLKSTFRIQTHSEIDTSTTSGHPLSFLFNEPLEFHWIRQWKLKFKVRTAQHCPTSPFCHIEICLHSAWQCGSENEFQQFEIQFYHFEVQFLGLLQKYFFLKNPQFVIKNCRMAAKSIPAAKYKVANTLGCSFT